MRHYRIASLGLPVGLMVAVIAVVSLAASGGQPPAETAGAAVGGAAPDCLG